MNTIKFRYNKYSPNVLSIMVILGVFSGLLIHPVILYFLGITTDPRKSSAYFNAHPQYAVYLIFALIPIVMIVPTWLVVRYWRSKEEEAEIHLYEDYAILYHRNKEVHINKGELKISVKTPRIKWYNVYVLKTPKNKIIFTTSGVEKKARKKSVLSLDIAMDKLMYYTRLGREKCAKDYYGKFYELDIKIGITKAKVFDNSPYYVDYENVIIVPDTPFVSCFIRERKNPTHVVGDIGIDTNLLTQKDFNKINLQEQAILEIIELDEQIEL